jgi:hypothetical protein
MQEAIGEEDGPEPAKKGPGPAGLFGSARGLSARFGAPFALGVCLFIASATVGRHIEQIILPTPFTRKPPPQDEATPLFM